MKTKTSLLIIYLTSTLATAGLASGAASAEDLPVLEKPAEDKPAPVAENLSLTEEGEPLVPLAFLSEPVVNKIELGIGYVSDDAYKFGRYNGLQTQGPYVIGNIKAREFYEDGRFWSVRGTDLGLESRYLRLEGGTQGRYKLFLEYDELPNYKDNTVKTPFIGIGSNNLTLPPGFDINNNLDTSLNNFELQTKRERIGVGAIFIPKQQWQFDVDFSHENKQGVDATGAAIATGTTQIVGNTTTSLLPEPIDYDTDIVNATLSYSGNGGQLGLSYQMSLFDNTNNSLTWQDPFNTAASGSMSLAPDNEFHLLSLTGGYYLPYRSHLTGLISMGRMTQNQDFQPYTVNPNVPATALPRSSLDGEVWLTTAQLKLASRPTDKLRLNAELKYHEHDNRTPTETYNYVILDSGAFKTATNRPYSYKNNRFNLDANYRFNAITSLRGGYKYNEMDRSYTNAERETTTEDTLFAKWKVKAHSTVDIALSAETSKRDGSDYIPLPNENPAMRKYNLADRNRDTVGASIEYMATEKLFLSFKADYNKDDYENSTIGLTEATQPVYTIDFSYQARHNISTYGYYTYENIYSSQASFDVAPPTPATSWEADFDDTFNTAGIGAKLTDLGKWDIGADIVYSKSSGTIKMKDVNNPGTENQYPDTQTALTSLKLWTSYDYNKQLSYRLGYRFEKYSADNWAIDGLQPYDPTVATGILLLGNEALDYDVHVITASASYRF
jgi:MtrB/PioB family decaheme-associated outer membrane protein